VGITVWSIACTACGFARDFAEIFFARLMVGAGEATLNPSANSILSDAFHKRGLTFALALFGCGATIGAAFAMVLVSYLITLFTEMGTVPIPLIGEVAPWRAVFIVVGLPGIIFAFLNFTMPEPGRHGRMSEQSPPFSAIWTFIKARKRYLICHFTGFSMMQLIGISFFSWMPTFMIRHHGWEVTQVGYVAGIATVSSIPLAMLIGWSVERLYRAGHVDVHFSAYAIMMPISAGLLIVGVLLPDPYVAVVLFSLSMGIAAHIGISSAALQLITPNEFRGQLSVIYLMTIMLVGAGIGPSIPAAFTDFVFRDDGKVGWSIALTTAIFAPIGAASLWFGREAARRAIDDAAAWSDR
jgi:MFS family permease